MKENSLSQIRLQLIAPNLQRIIVKQNSWTAGEIDLTERIFYSIPRSHKNLFYLFHGDEGGIGINQQILMMSSYDLIKIKFCDKVLTTFRLKWINKGIVSPYCNQSVDKQIILKLSDINMDDAEKFNHAQIQQGLFEEVI